LNSSAIEDAMKLKHMIKPHGGLVLVSLNPYGPYTPSLSTT
jgi:hypothetical protein